jgi:hypothetical protein
VNPDEAKEWLPVVRDYLILIVGVILLLTGIIIHSTPLLIVALVMTGLGTIIRGWFDARFPPPK